MIDGNLAYKADEPDVREWQACQWPDGCTRGGVRLVDMPGVGELWLCRHHAGETWPGRPVVKVRKHDDPRDCKRASGGASGAEGCATAFRLLNADDLRRDAQRRRRRDRGG